MTDIFNKPIVLEMGYDPIIETDITETFLDFPDA